MGVTVGRTRVMEKDNERVLKTVEREQEGRREGGSGWRKNTSDRS